MSDVGTATTEAVDLIETGVGSATHVAVGVEDVESVINAFANPAIVAPFAIPAEHALAVSAEDEREVRNATRWRRVAFGILGRARRQDTLRLQVAAMFPENSSYTESQFPGLFDIACPKHEIAEVRRRRRNGR